MLLDARAAGVQAQILAGGQSLVPQMLRRQSRPGLIVDINRLPDLDQVAATPQGLIMGALVRLEDARRHRLVVAALPVLADALCFVANPTVRRRGTVVGNVLQNAPGAELPALALAQECRVMIAQGATRWESTAAALLGETADALPREALVTHVLWPMLGGDASDPARRDEEPRGGFWEIAARDGHQALVGAGVAWGGRRGCRVGVCGLGLRPLRPRRVEAAIATALPHPLPTAAIATALAADLASMPAFVAADDVLADAAYRLDVAPLVIHRALLRGFGHIDDE